DGGALGVELGPVRRLPHADGARPARRCPGKRCPARCTRRAGGRDPRQHGLRLPDRGDELPVAGPDLRVSRQLLRHRRDLRLRSDRGGGAAAARAPRAGDAGAAAASGSTKLVYVPPGSHWADTSMSTEPYLLTPGPLTTSLRTRQSMLRDWGSWDVDFNSITGRVRERLLEIVHGSGTHECVPMQGSGTFSVEAAVGTLVPRTGHVLVPQNGAYCQRIARICRVLGRKLTSIDYAENTPVAAADIERALRADPSITHVALVHCETSTGILNPLAEVAQVVSRHGRGLIVDAMSSFGALEIDARTTPFDAVVAASGKCLEGP